MRPLRVLVGPLIASLAVLAAFLVLYESPGLDPRLAAPRFHFWLVSSTSLLALVLAMAIVGGRVLRDDAERRLAYGLRPEVRGLVAATEAKDLYTAGHMQRVAAYAVRLGRSLGFDADDLRALAQAGAIHDVGKIEIPDAVLNKPGALNDQEFSIIEQHPEVGARMARELGMLRSELQIIRHHHERWDGGGYPDGLAGAEIPVLARVLAVADVYDAMTSDRSYRRPLDREQALQYVSEQAGKSFDPVHARAWVEMLGAAAASPRKEPPRPRERLPGRLRLRPSRAE